MTKGKVVVLLAAGLVIGGGIGYAGASSQEPEVRRVEVTPPACVEALDIAAEFSDVMVRWPGIAQRSLTAGMAYDVTEITQLTGEVREITADVEALTRRVEVVAPECRGKA